MKLLRALVSTAIVASACNGQFRFDEAIPDASDSSDAGSSGDTADVGTSGEGGAPATCVRDDDCRAAGLRCDPSAGTCVVCVEDIDCSGATPRCDTALHRCVECGSASDCGDAGRCEPRTRRCQTTCADDASACGKGFECEREDGVYLCMRCEKDESCREKEPDKPHCDPNLFVCVECTVDSQCSAGAPICDRTRGRCVECTRPSHCPSSRPTCGAQSACL